MSTEKLILVKTMQFGGAIREAFKKGTVFVVDRDNCEIKVPATGQSFKDLRCVDICIRHNAMVPYTKALLDQVLAEADVSEPRPLEKPAIPPALPVIQSDRDNTVDRDIRWTKKANQTMKPAGDRKMEVVREDSDEEIRGITVLRSTPQDKEVALPSSAESVKNADGNNIRITLRVGKGAAKTVKTPTSEAAEKALAAKEARKKMVDAKRQKAGVSA